MNVGRFEPCGVLDDWRPALPGSRGPAASLRQISGKSHNLRDLYPDGIQLVITVEDTRQPDPTSRERLARLLVLSRYLGLLRHLLQRQRLLLFAASHFFNCSQWAASFAARPATSRDASSRASFGSARAPLSAFNMP